MNYKRSLVKILFINKLSAASLQPSTAYIIVAVNRRQKILLHKDTV